MNSNFIQLIENLVSSQGEAETLEFKENYSNPDQEGRDISALSNSAAYHGARFAYKVWGVDDRTKEIKGTSFRPEKEKKGNAPLEIWLKQQLTDNANFEFESGEYNGKHVVLLKVWPAIHHPVEFEHKAYIRKGSHTQAVKSGSAIESELWAQIQKQDFEKQIAKEDMPVEEALRLLLVNEYFDALDLPRPTDQEGVLHYFEKDGLIKKQDDGFVSITNLGALLFANDLEDFSTVKRKTIRVSRYDGKGRAAPRSEREFKQGYAIALKEVYSYLEGMLEAPEIISGAKREGGSYYSEVALRELITNALIHQNLSVRGAGPLIEVFENRVEITNPGAPLIDSERLVNDPPRSRNEDLSALMRRLRYCEESGTGWDKVVEGCEQYRAPAPKVEVQSGESDSMRVVLFQPRAYKQLTPDERIDACYWHACIRLANREYVSNASLRERFGVDNSNAAQISRLIKEAQEAGLIKPVDSMASRKFMLYQPYWA